MGPQSPIPTFSRRIEGRTRKPRALAVGDCMIRTGQKSNDAERYDDVDSDRDELER